MIAWLELVVVVVSLRAMEEAEVLRSSFPSKMSRHYHAK
jgi:hypothetical protein